MKAFLGLLAVVGLALSASGITLVDMYVQAPAGGTVGQDFLVPIFVESDPNTEFAGAQVMISYDPTKVVLYGCISTEYTWVNQGQFFPADGQGINLDIGDGLAIALFLGDIQGQPPATPLELCALQFHAVGAGAAEISITYVWQGWLKTIVAGLGTGDITGDLFNDTIQIVGPPPDEPPGGPK